MKGTKLFQSFVLLISIGASVSTTVAYNDALRAQRPPRDRFRMIQNNVDEQRLSDEIEDFTAYGCEKMVVIRNKAQEAIKLSCKSHHDSPKATKIEPGKAYAFSFRPQKNGQTKFWCGVEYLQQYAQFDVYNEDMPYMCPRDIHEVHQYVVHHDGVYIDKSKGGGGEKIRALMKGHNKFILWEEFKDGETDGFLVSGLVDGGMCYDVPEQFNDRTAAVTVCNSSCVHLYEHYGCEGEEQLVHAGEDCKDVGVSEELGKKMSSVKGC